MEECGRLRPRASEPLKQDVVVVAILVDVVAGVVDDDYDDHDDAMAECDQLCPRASKI